ncbi:DNA-binding transcriptional LysR family regulator [Streptosporangium becharense]|uniref:DNA-binding transcriptional LysR family regulator n=1 Tax=Streptosporangium becharense TaxID=1816182 RepID=A0A7W9IC36_9ACTN|nr:LysR family transcriptional regulator [Streptosporangium becharense]MBB2915189.1 DNA-binding transcriptional LysR family regulator [Streptosporangium becharense]MBB5817982.1 DNA-binding transcriptional LysR family regulator [Streptosporangium becharense]
MPDLDLLLTFLEIYRAGSLTEAATRRGLTQPAVSGQLTRLERQVGEALFVRSRRGVSPTGRADDLARRIGTHLDQLRSALDVLGDGGTAYGGTVRIAGPAELMTARILPALAPLTGRGLRLRITLGLAGDLLAALADARLDLVVSAVRPTLRNLVATPFADEEFVLVGPPILARTVDAGLLAGDPVKALAHLPLVAYAEELPIVRRYWRTEFGRRPPNGVAVVVPDLRAVLAAVVAGAGVSVLPRYLAEPALASGSVEVLHRPQVQPLNTLFLVTRAGGPAAPSVALVHGHLMERSRAWSSL